MIQRCTIVIVLFFLLFLTQTPAWSKDRPRIGLVLSGGGARGLAHIGVLKVLQELRIPIDAIAATSMGAVVGGLYAAGTPVQEMESLVTSLNWLDLFTDNPPRRIRSNRRKQDDYKQLSRLSIGYRDGSLLFPPGVISGQRMGIFLLELSEPVSEIDDFDQLPIPFRAIATDLVSGQMVVFKNGKLDAAMRSSMSIPGVIAPYGVGEMLLVDGGLVRNLPVEIARSMNVDHLIAVNLGTPLLKRDALNSVLGVTAQMIAILTEQNVQQSLARLRPDDVLILPQLGDITAADFERAAEAIEVGVVATRSREQSLRRFSVSDQQYARWRQRFASLIPPKALSVIDEIRIEKLDNVNPERIRSLIRTQVGQPADQETLQQDIDRIYGTGDFERVTYRFIEEQGRQVLTIDAFEKSWGPNYLRFGLGFSGDFQGNSDLNLLTNYNQTWYNSSGAEWQTDVQLGTNMRIGSAFYQPFSATSQWFITPYFDVQSGQIDIFDGSDKIAKYDVGSAAFGINLGFDLRDHGELRFGLEYALIDAEPNIGATELPKIDAKQGALTASYVYDGLDNLNFPKSGSALNADLYLASTYLGGDQSYSKLQGEWVSAFTQGKNTLAPGVKLGGRLDANPIPVYDEFVLGGFLQLSGYQNQQLRGQFMGLARLVFYREIANIAGTLGGTLYLGGSLEAGNVWQDSEEIRVSDLRLSSSIFFGADTLLGPLYLGYGVSDSGDNSAYLFLGRP